MNPVPAPAFPRLNQGQMAGFLDIDVSRLAWAGRKGIVSRDADGFYPLDVVTAEWLTYERSRNAKGKHRSEIEARTLPADPG